MVTDTNDGFNGNQIETTSTLSIGTMIFDLGWPCLNQNDERYNVDSKDVK